MLCQLCLYSVWTLIVGHWCILLFFHVSWTGSYNSAVFAKGSLFLNIGGTTLFEKYNGVFSSFTISRNIIWSMLTFGFPPAFSTSAVIRSDPGALLFLSKEIAFLSSYFNIKGSIQCHNRVFNLILKRKLKGNWRIKTKNIKCHAAKPTYPKRSYYVKRCNFEYECHHLAFAQLVFCIYQTS